MKYNQSKITANITNGYESHSQSGKINNSLLKQFECQVLFIHIGLQTIKWSALLMWNC